MKQSKVVRQWDMFIQGIDRRERVIKSSLASLPFCLARGRSSRNLSADYFTAIPAGERIPLPSISSREDPVRLRAELIERVFCRSIGRRRRIGGRGRKKEKRDSRRGSAREREGGRKRQTDEEGRSEWRERGERRLLPSRELLLDRNVERPRWLVRLDSSKSGIGYDKYRSWGIKSEPRISPRRA